MAQRRRSRRCASAQRPSRDRAGVGDGGAALAVQPPSDPSLPGFGRSGRRCEVVSVADRRSPRGLCEGRGAEGDVTGCPGRTPACARARRRRRTGSRRWKSSLRGFVRPGRSGRGPYGRKSDSRTSRARNASAEHRGAPGHGRTQVGLDERTEEHNPPPDACVCGGAGALCAERRRGIHPRPIEVKAYKR